MKKKLLGMILTLALVQVGIVGCGSADDVADVPATTKKMTEEDIKEEKVSEPVTVRIGYFSVNNGTPELYVASNLGYLEEELGENVTVELIPFANGPAANEAFIAGKIDFQNGEGDLPVLNGWRNGIDTKIIAQTGNNGEHLGLVASKKSGITSVEELAGKNVGVYIGTTFHKSVLGILSDHGLSAGDVNLVNIDSTADGVAALASGNLDAYYVPSSYYVDYASENGIGELIEDSVNYPIPGYVVGTTEFLEAHPDIVKGILRAYKRGADYINEDLKAGATEVASFLGTEYDAAYSVLQYEDVSIELTDEVVNNLYVAEKFLYDIGAVETELTQEEIDAHIDYSYVNEILSE